MLERMRGICQSIKEDNRANMGNKFNPEDTSDLEDRTKIDNLLENRIYHLATLRRAELDVAKVDKKALAYTSKSLTNAEWEKDASESLGFMAGE
jgi:hypothetical protein